eukprot:TRINITY_DN9061_c0_g1_i3.p2 TRINITY_DN9061_c0_g1~~TRINITY_DN9061_c0_g1_i3.p2  ORF type:complete len:105 (+),score=20.58 TRINITY_DN9061_c0_g1_i3:74-388(+)
MSFTVLFGSRILPQAARRVATAPTPIPVRNLVTIGGGVTKMPAVTLTNRVVAGGPTLQLVRHAHSRGVFKSQRGAFYMFMWVFGFAAIAGFVQELGAPYVFFHE